MKKSFLILISFFLAVSLWAVPVKKETAVEAAVSFYKFRAPAEITDFSVKEVLTITEAEQTVMYAVIFKSGGFVLVASDDAVIPIIAYSHDKNSEKGFYENYFPSFTTWISDYGKQVNIIVNKKLSNSETKKQWNDVLKGRLSKGGKDVSPLTTTLWDQGCYYNQLCPADASGDCGHVFTGCVATAMAQIMKYHNFPAQGTGTHTYTHPTYGDLTADFGSTTYNWTNMPNSLSAGSTTTQKDAVATLMFHCGVAVEMDYGPDGSGAFSEDVPAVLINNFGYNSSAEMKSKDNYSLDDWKALLRTELDGARPIYYAGSSDASGGHAFVCDGYRMSDEKFRFNWGWSGYSNGYYTIGYLNPSGYNFNDNNRAIIGIKPPYVAPQIDDAYKLMSNKLDTDSIPVYPLLNYDWIDITDGSGSEVTVSDDGVAGPFSLGQEFVYFRDAHKVTQFWIGDNGHLNFYNGTALSATFQNIPSSSGANDFIAPLLGDYAGTGVGNAGNESKIFYRVDADKLIVTYQNYKHWQSAAPGYSGNITFQAIFYKDGNFKFQYQDYSAMNWTDPGGNGTDEHDPIIGCENSSGTIGYAWLNYNVPLDRRTAIVTNGVTFIPGLVILGHYTHKHPSIKDVAMEWVNVEGDENNTNNKGAMIIEGSKKVGIKLTNVGTLDAASIQVRAQITPLGGSSVYSPYQNIGTLAPGETRIITLSGTNLPYTFNVPDGTGYKTYSVKGMLTCTGDVEAGNNSATTEYMAIEQSVTGKELKWVGTAAASNYYSGVFGFDAGAIEFIPPFNVYPLTVNSIDFYAARSTETPGTDHNMYIQVFKILPDGSIDINNPLTSETAVDISSILAPNTAQEARFSVPMTDLILDEVGTGIAIKYRRVEGVLLYTDEAGPFSRRNYEILDPMGLSWTAYRNNEVEDAAIFPVCSYTALSTVATLNDLQSDGVTVNGFSPSVYDYNIGVPIGSSVVPVVTATPTLPATVEITQGVLPFPSTATITVTAEAGNTQIYTVTFSESNNIETIEINTDVYPNPVNNFLFISVNSDMKYIINDIMGKTILHGELVSGKNFINSSMLNEGVYFLVLVDGNRKSVRKISVLR